jgi:hypothetical protein
VFAPEHSFSPVRLVLSADLSCDCLARSLAFRRLNLKMRSVELSVVDFASAVGIRAILVWSPVPLAALLVVA